MKRVTNFTDWKEATGINEGYEITLQAAIALAVLGFAGLRQIFLSIAKSVGGKQKLEEGDLLNLVDEGMDAIRKADKSGASFTQLERELKARVKSGKIQTINDILKSIDELTQ